MKMLSCLWSPAELLLLDPLQETALHVCKLYGNKVRIEHREFLAQLCGEDHNGVSRTAKLSVANEMLQLVQPGSLDMLLERFNGSGGCLQDMESLSLVWSGQVGVV